MTDSRKAVRPKTKRQVPAMAGALLLIVGVALGFVMWSSAQSSRTPVLVAATDIDRGDVITRDVLRVSDIGLDQGLISVNETSLNSLIGRVATQPISSGALVTPAMFGSAQGVPSGFVLVGATLDTGRYPSSGLRIGDPVTLIWTLNGAPTRIGESEIFAVEALVNDLAGDMFVTLLVPQGPMEISVAAAAADGDLSVLVTPGGN